MKLFFDIEDYYAAKKSVVTIGTFDGFHLGHQYIVKEMKKVAFLSNLTSVLLTFSRSPSKVLKKKEVGLLTTLEEKIELAKLSQIDSMVVLSFSEVFANQSYQKFLKKILLEKMKLRHLIFGYNHAFGNRREGTFKKLYNLSKRLKFSTSQVEPFYIAGKIVSSSLIRNQILSGLISEANKCLGWSYSLLGTVVKGEKRGRLLGFPTANVSLDCLSKIVPKVGVYFVKTCVLGETFFGMCNVGTRPTFGGEKRRIEVYIFNFNQDIYKEKVILFFLSRIRDEHRFQSEEDLKKQLSYDKDICRKKINMFK